MLLLSPHLLGQWYLILIHPHLCCCSCTGGTVMSMEATAFYNVVIAYYKDPMYFVSLLSHLLPLFFVVVVVPLPLPPIPHPHMEYLIDRYMVRGGSVLNYPLIFMALFIIRKQSRGHHMRVKKSEILSRLLSSSQVLPIYKSISGV